MCLHMQMLPEPQCVRCTPLPRPKTFTTIQKALPRARDLGARATDEIHPDDYATLRDELAEYSTDAVTLSELLSADDVPDSECIYYVKETGFERAVSVRLRDGRKAMMSVARVAYAVSTINVAAPLAEGQNVAHTCGGDFYDTDGIRRVCVHPAHLVPVQ